MDDEKIQINYVHILTELVEKHKIEIFGENSTHVKIEKLTLGPKLYNHELSYGRLLKILYRLHDSLDEKWIFVKVRFRYQLAPDSYMEIYDHFPPHEQFLPKFYFSKKIKETDELIIGIEFFKGTSLRNLLLMKMFLRKTGNLKKYFFENGEKMRMFHDSQHGSANKTIGEFIKNTRQKLDSSPCFDNSEKDRINLQISNIEKEVDTELALPLIHIHHDWSLRNIIICEKHKLKIIDLDAFNRSIDWRWNDFVHFLINLESQVKYWPLISLKDIKALWTQFECGYFNAGGCDSVNQRLLQQLIYLIKVDAWTDKYSLANFYNIGIGKRFVKKFKNSLFIGNHTILK